MPSLLYRLTQNALIKTRTAIKCAPSAHPFLHLFPFRCSLRDHLCARSCSGVGMGASLVREQRGVSWVCRNGTPLSYTRSPKRAQSKSWANRRFRTWNPRCARRTCSDHKFRSHFWLQPFFLAPRRLRRRRRRRVRRRLRRVRVRPIAFNERITRLLTFQVPCELILKPKPTLSTKSPLHSALGVTK